MKTNKIILIIVGLVVIGLLVVLLVKNQNKKITNENQGQTKNNTETVVQPTREEVLTKNGFSDSSPRWGGGYVDGHPNVGIEGFFSAYFGQRLEKALLILKGGTSTVYDTLIINPISYCLNCSPLALDFCINPEDTNNKSSIVGLYEIATHRPIQAWTINPNTLKFQEYKNFQHLQCNLGEEID